MDCEILAGRISQKAESILSAMTAAAHRHGISARRTKIYQGSSELYMTWGLSHPQRREWTDRHVKNGGRVISWDLGYWDRMNKFRVTIDHDHPHRMVSDMPDTRSGEIVLRDDYDPLGHVVIVGLGRKARIGMTGQTWESQAEDRVMAAYPDREIVHRPKLKTSAPISEILKGASLVVCRHSNVAIDACIANIPVVCEDGIAFSVYRDDLKKPVMPDLATRRQFIANVGWWQWAPCEAKHAWNFILERINATSC